MTPGRDTGHKTLIPAEGEISSSAMFQFNMCTVESGWMNKRKLMDNTAEEKTSMVKKFQSADVHVH